MEIESLEASRSLLGKTYCNRKLTLILIQETIIKATLHKLINFSSIYISPRDPINETKQNKQIKQSFKPIARLP